MSIPPENVYYPTNRPLHKLPPPEEIIRQYEEDPTRTEIDWTRRYHTDESRLCNNCQRQGEIARRLQRCTGCEYTWYCNATCQKAHWKKHKAECKRYQSENDSAPKGVMRVQARLREWVRTRNPLIGFAADEALLPSKDEPEHNLLDTHVLVIDLLDKKGAFEVIKVRVGLFEEVAKNFDALGQLDEYHRTMENLREMQKGTEERIGETLLGTAYTMIRCPTQGTLLMQFHPLFIKRSVLPERLAKDREKDWETTFRKFAPMDQKLHLGPGGKLFMMDGDKKIDYPGQG